MPTYEITAPDGRKFRVTGPEGSTREQALEQVKSRYTAQPAADDPMLDPTGSFAENALAGMGKAFVDAGRGIRDVYHDLGGGTPESRAAAERSVAESRRLDAPLMGTGGGLAGNIAGNIAATAPTMAVPGINTLRGAAALGAGFGAMQPTIEDESRTGNALLGAGAGVAGQTVGNAIGRVVRPVRSAPDAETGGLLRAAADAGIPTSAANKTGNKFLAVMDSVIDYIPIAGDMNAKAKAGQQAAWTRALFKQAGVDDAIEASPATLSAAKDALGDSYETILGRNNVRLESETVLDALIEAEEKLNQFTPGKARTAVKKAIDLFQSRKELPGREFKQIYATLRDETDSAFKGQGGGSTAAAKVMEKLRDGLKAAWEESADPADVAALAQADKRYAVLKSIEKATTDGQISPKKFFNEMERRLPQMMKYGKGDQTVPDLARIGRRFVAENVPNSGTSQREMVRSMLGQGGSGAAALGLLSGAIPPAALANVGLGLATPIAAQRALWGPSQRYLTQGLLSLPKGAQPYAAALPRGAGVGLIGADQ